MALKFQNGSQNDLWGFLMQSFRFGSIAFFKMMVHFRVAQQWALDLCPWPILLVDCIVTVITVTSVSWYTILYATMLEDHSCHYILFSWILLTIVMPFWISSSVQLEQGTVTSLLEENGTIKGVQYKTKDGKELTACAPLTIVCDGCFSNLRRTLCDPQVWFPLNVTHRTKIISVIGNWCIICPQSS